MQTKPTASKPIPRLTWTAIILLGFSGQLAWGVENQYFNTFVYDNIIPDPRPISWMVAASAITATLTSILMGALSDRTRSRWGKRKPFILIGYLAWGIFTAAFPSAAFLTPVTLAVGMAILFDCDHDLLRLDRQRRRLECLYHRHHRSAEPRPGDGRGGDPDLGGDLDRLWRLRADHRCLGLLHLLLPDRWAGIRPGAGWRPAGARAARSRHRPPLVLGADC